MDAITQDFRQKQEESLNDHTYKIDDHAPKISENDQKSHNCLESTKELDSFRPIHLS